METISIQINNPKAMSLLKDLAKLNLITIKPKSQDFWTALNENQQVEIENSLSEIQRGETIDYEDILSKHRQ